MTSNWRGVRSRLVLRKPGPRRNVGCAGSLRNGPHKTPRGHPGSAPTGRLRSGLLRQHKAPFWNFGFPQQAHDGNRHDHKSGNHDETQLNGNEYPALFTSHARLSLRVNGWPKATKRLKDVLTVGFVQS